MFSSQRVKKAPRDQIPAGSKPEETCPCHRSFSPPGQVGRDHRAGMLCCVLHGPMRLAQPRQTDADDVKGKAVTVQHWELNVWLPAIHTGLIAQLVRAYG